ncbi:MAG: D-alanyl-D-alanine carboxypeptidase (penicillin-binding protein 5/6), partial [Flavobacteriaceae bacterium]
MAKKWLFSALLIAIVISLVSPAYSQILRPAEPEIAAKAWILIDATTGKVLLERNADERLPPASLAKIMTIYIVSNEIVAQRVNEETEVLISDNAWILGGAKTDGSTMFLSPRTKVSVL